MAKRYFFERHRGDSKPFEITIEVDGTAEDITGWTFRMTVSSDENPTDNTNRQFELTGSITDATNGVVQFVPSTVQMDLDPETYWFDIEATVSGVVETIKKGRLLVIQDISK